MAIKDAGMHVTSCDVAGSDGNQTITMVIPDGNRVFEVVFEITTLFAGGTPVILVGYTGVTNAFLADAGITEGTAGVYKASAGAATKAGGYKLGTGEDVLVTVSGTPTSGVARCYVYHAVSV